MNAEDAQIEFLDTMIELESGQLAGKESVELFQRLIDEGIVWKLQGSYGRTAQYLIKAGRCMLGPTGHRDYYGNYIPSRFEVKPGTPGSVEFVKAQT